MGLAAVVVRSQLGRQGHPGVLPTANRRAYNRAQGMCEATSAACMRFCQNSWLLSALVAAFLVVPLVVQAAPKPPRPNQRAAVPEKVRPPAPSDTGTPAVAPRKQAVADFKSQHFLIHTDLSAKDAHALLNRLEQMLSLIAKYWGQASQGVIECYVVDDLAAWPDDAIEPAGRAAIQARGGITLGQSMFVANRLTASKSIVYATVHNGTPQHEAVHAYCGQTFGRVGPLWYGEGMAEMGKYWRAGDVSVHCPPTVLRYLHNTPLKPLGEVIADEQPRASGPAAASGDSWQNYAWRWALCHVLANNANYAERFRALGLAYLTGQKASFQDAYGGARDQIAFEYRFFLQHVGEGFRADLCSWDWKRKFRSPEGNSIISSRILAARGWQPTGVTVTSGRSYDISASGTWRTSADARATTADGDISGSGQLEGVLLKDLVLSDPFALHAYGSFKAPGDGQLYVRCRDAWTELSDNKGAMQLKIKRAGHGLPLPKPSSGPPAPADDDEIAGAPRAAKD